MEGEVTESAVNETPATETDHQTEENVCQKALFIFLSSFYF